MSELPNNIADAFGNATATAKKAREEQKSTMWHSLEIWGETTEEPGKLVRMASIMSTPLDEVHTLDPKSFFGTRAEQQYRMDYLLRLRDAALKLEPGTSWVINGDNGKPVSGFNIVITHNAEATERHFTSNPVDSMLAGLDSL